MGTVNKFPSICFSVVSHGHGVLLGQLLASIVDRGLIDAERDQVIVTLNLPEDEGFLVQGASLPITVIRNKSPKGFGANHNAAFALCRSDLFCVLNPDLHLRSLDLMFMREVLGDMSVGVWAPLVYAPAMTVEDSARRFPTPSILLKRYLLRRRLGDYAVSDDPVEVDWVAGMFLAFRCSVFRNIGGFDESFYMYMEDVDICRRLNRSSLKVIYDPRTSIIHDARRDSRRNLRFLIWHLGSVLRYFFRAN